MGLGMRSKNSYKVEMWLEEIGLRAQNMIANMIAIIGSTIDIIGGIQPLNNCDILHFMNK